MFRPLTRSHRQPPRRGTSFILIVVAMTSLLAAIGTAYVLFAMQQAKTAMLNKDAQGGGAGAPLLTAPDPTSTVNQFFAALIFDQGDNLSVDSNGFLQGDLSNSLRGQSIARSMYGRDVLVHNTALNQLAQSQPLLSQFLTTPWNGVGLFHEDSAGYSVNGVTGDRAQFVNYTLLNFNNNPFLLDPEYMGMRPINSGTVQPLNPANRTYVSKAAGYSYPDLKDFFLASLDPVTGQVLVPSFYRLVPFGPQGLSPANPIWQSAQGKLVSLRPWPTDHPQFPRVPQNADGSFSGDVQNLPGGVGIQKNDSLWMNLGLPVITLPGGKKVQPLVAPLIVPLNGLLNPNVHGNVYGGPAHLSYAGYGPWEVNLSSSFAPIFTNDTDRQNIINTRILQQRIGTSTRNYAPYNNGSQLPSYAPVAWNNQMAVFPIYPTGNTLTGLPTFTTPPFQYDNTAVSHPSLFNPTEWYDLPSGHVFPLSDTKRLQLRYMNTPDWYFQSILAGQQYSQAGLYGNTNPFVAATGQTTPNGYRLDPSHPNRFLFTTRSYDLARPKMVPNFTTGSLQLSALAAGSIYAPKPSYGTATTSYPSPLTQTIASPGNDFTAQNRWSNMMAILGSVDLNRPLADYRGNNTSAGLSAGNIGNQNRADLDRRKLAHDIFLRLVVATGAGGVTILPASLQAGVEYPAYQYTVAATAGNPQYDALRYLAQLAVNIVDYIDNDDISTVFVWNPATNPTNGTDPSTDASNFAAAQIGNRVVFGHEKARLVINEAYAEIVNDQTDPVNGATITSFPTKDLQVRFWLELLNPSTLLNPPNGPLGNGSVPLTAYQIQIRRETRLTDAPTKDMTGQSVYLFGLQSNSNTAGNFDITNGQPDAIFSLSGAAITTVTPPANNTYAPATANLPNGGIVLVGPPAPAKMGSKEFAPDPTLANSIWANTNALQSPALGQAQNSSGMGYTIKLQDNNSTYSDAEFKRHIVLLRRAANPYLNPNDPSLPTFNNMAPINPYVTVDVMDYVPAFDGVHRGKMDAMDRGSYDMATNMTGYDPATSRFSIGKVQPYAGHSVATINSGAGKYNNYGGGNNPASTNLSTSMVQPQVSDPTNSTPQSAADAMNTENAPKNTFGRHNGTTNTMPPGPNFTAGATPMISNTIMLPFDWLPHMDRPLVNELEIFPVRDTPPYRVTDQFVLPSSTYSLPNGTIPGVTYEAGTPVWLTAPVWQNQTTAAGNVATGLARVLEYLTVKPYVMGVPHGGRVPGKINVNGIPDQRVLMGLMDPQTGNTFDQTFVINTAWSNWLNSRRAGGVTTSTTASGSPMPTVPTVGINPQGLAAQSAFDANSYTAGTQDWPFLPFGAPIASTGNQFTLAYGAGSTLDQTVSNLDLTILRRPASGSATNPSLPYLYANTSSKTATPTYTTALPFGPTYMQSEPVRKILNNITTVNHQYAVYLTIGYFEVVGTVSLSQAPAPTVNIPQLGAEAYLNVPGDMRQKFFGVVDMSNMALDPINNAIASPPVQTQTWYPFFTSLETTSSYGNGTTQTGTLNIACAGVDTKGNPVVGADGQLISITPGDASQNPPIPPTTLVIGYGSEQQVVTVTSATVPMGSTFAQLTVTTVNGQPFRTAWAGTCVSNVRPGYPGPQASFDYTNPVYKPVLPYLERLK